MGDLVIQPEFQHILRMLNTNIDGRTSVQYALTAIPGIGRRFSNLICKKADIDLSKRAGELTPEEVEKLIAIISNPLQFKIPVWYLNRRKDIKPLETFDFLYMCFIFCFSVDLGSRGPPGTPRDPEEPPEIFKNH